tara:strand:- start:3938 stop:4489 length:552 start_codon:yes stop_codon:yes gene_type:complete
MKFYFFLFLFSIHTFVFADGKLRLRAREHFQWHRISLSEPTSSLRYFGLSNTLNLFWEEPFHRSYGLAVGPMLGSASIQSHLTPEFGSKIRQWIIGGEWKEYPFKENKGGVFGRVGIGATALQTGGSLGTLWGAYGYFGIGYEFLIANKVGINPEVAFRQSFYETGVSVSTLTPSIGLHFYVF